MGVLASVILSVAVGFFPPGEGPAEARSVAANPVVDVALAPGDSGADVERLQFELTRNGFRPSTKIDGQFGGGTYQAVLAFQKHHGLERDGVFRPEHWELLDGTLTARYRPEPDRVEIDVGRQVLYLIEQHRVTAVLPVSTGNGGTFRNYTGNLVRASTPEGKFTFYMERNYNHTSYLGSMYRPYYFRGGYAIHGSPSVPPGPASHGCVRVTNSDMDWLRPHLDLGMTVYVYGLRTENPPAPTVSRPPALVV